MNSTWSHLITRVCDLTHSAASGSVIRIRHGFTSMLQIFFIGWVQPSGVPDGWGFPSHHRTNRLSIRIKLNFKYLNPNRNNCRNFCKLHLIQSCCLWEYSVAAWVTSHSERATSFIRSQRWIFHEHIQGRDVEKQTNTVHSVSLMGKCWKLYGYENVPSTHNTYDPNLQREERLCNLVNVYLCWRCVSVCIESWQAQKYIIEFLSSFQSVVITLYSLRAVFGFRCGEVEKNQKN